MALMENYYSTRKKYDQLEILLTDLEQIDADILRLEPLFLVLYRLCKARGQKVIGKSIILNHISQATIVKFFSHEVSHLEPAIEFFLYLSSSSTFKASWEMKFILLLWMSLICMIPFDLKRIDSLRGGVPLVERILDIAKTWIPSVGKEYEGAGILAMRLLTRFDLFLPLMFLCLEKMSVINI